MSKSVENILGIEPMKILRFSLALFLLITGVFYSITHYPADALAFAPTIEIGRGSIRDIDWHPSGEMLTVDTIRGAWIYTDTLTDITHLEIQRAHFSPNGEWIAGVDEQHHIVLYDTVNFEPQITLSGHRDTVVQVEWHPTDSNRLASIEENGQLMVWDVDARKAVFRDKTIDNIQKLLWNPSGDYVAAMDTLGGIVVWEIAAKQSIFSLPSFNADESATFDIVWNDTDILTRGWTYDGGKIETWSVTARMKVSTPSWQGLQMVLRIAIPSPDQLHLAVIGDWGEFQHYGDVGIFDYAGNERLQELPSVYFWVDSGAWSPDSTKLVVWDIDSEFYTWDVAHNHHLGKNTAHGMIAKPLSWRDDGKIIATGSEINEGHLWDAETGEHLATLTGQMAMIHSLAWQPKGTLLATSGWGYGVFNSSDNNIQVWDTGEITSPFEPLAIIKFEQDVLNIMWNDAGTQLLINSDTKVYVWDVAQHQIVWQIDFRQRVGWCCPSLRNVVWNSTQEFLYVIYDGNGGGGFSTLVLDGRSGQVLTSGAGSGLWLWKKDNSVISASWGYCCRQNGFQPFDTVHIGTQSDYSNPTGATERRWTIPLQLTFADFDRSGEFLLGIDIDSNLVTWNLEDNRRELLVPNHFISAIFSPDSNLIAAYGDINGSIIHRKSGRIYGTLVLAASYYALAFSPDSRRIAVVHDGVLTIYDSTPDCMASIFRPFIEGEAYCEGS